MIAKLLYADGTLKEKVVLLNKFPFLIGRHSEADHRIDHPLVSRRHCEITEENGVLIVRDLGSRNGIFVNDVSVKESALKRMALPVGCVGVRANGRHRQGSRVNETPMYTARNLDRVTTTCPARSCGAGIKT